MSTKTLLAESNHLRQEAEGLLELTDIISVLDRFGRVNLIGSYSYNVMMARDIDFHVLIDNFDQKLVSEFLDYAVSSALFEEIIFHDKHRFNGEAAARYASKKALDSYYFELRITYKSEYWKIGINFITSEQEASIAIGKLFDNATDSQREQILIFKADILATGVKVSSSYIYKAVIELGIDDKDELLSYLKNIGYTF